MATRTAGLVIILNLLDALWTLCFVEAGVANEANPLMSSALGHGPVSFMVLKLALVSLSVLLLWRLRHRRSANVALYSGATAYSLVVAYHLANAHHLVGAFS
ncbi:MAG: DUF5658 family protein [Deltaproteobacteria bacterium]|nr:DUF5658 family protein [Kofleriaceae bacterium]